MDNQSKKTNYCKLLWVLGITLIIFCIYHFSNSTSVKPTITQSGGSVDFSNLNETIQSFKNILKI
jgi:hypothetical protein